ncbi:unnamed protein product [Amoebophrya sp. A120]|nr:unnamed protein product [Amoebophrya sp. A120]|eukprot:GSA120T00005449001.1
MSTSPGQLSVEIPQPSGFHNANDNLCRAAAANSRTSKPHHPSQNALLLALAVLSITVESAVAQYLTGANVAYCQVDAQTGLTQNNRICLQSCNLIEGTPQPTYAQWNAFCRTTASSGDWPEQCRDYYECVLGCDISERLIGQGTTGGSIGRQLMLLRPENLSSEDKCEMKKCESYCMFQTQLTCREESFRIDCEGWASRQFNPCDVNCSFAASRFGGSSMLFCFAIVLLSIFAHRSSFYLPAT